MYLYAVLLALLPTSALAHTRWFADNGLPIVPTDEPAALYLGVWGAIALAIVLIGIYFERHGILQFERFKPHRDHALARAASTFSMATGAFFLIAGTHEYLFSPNLTSAAGIPYAFIVVQILVGAAFLAGIYARVAALVLGLLWFASFGYTGIIAAFENAWVLGTALFILIMGSDYFSLVPLRKLAHLVRPYHDWALPLLRIGAGTTLLVLGFSEKILRPEFGINFLEQYQWNFMQFLGFEWYSDYLFTLSAGAVESLLGLVFILGIATRLNALVTLTIFTIPLFILGPVELAGHLPHLAAITLLLLFGSGTHLKIVSHHSRHAHRGA